MRPQGRFWTVPNVLSMSRLVLLPLFIWALVSPGYLWLAALLVGWAIASDVADGYLARKLNQQSEWGRLLDPLADKLAVAAVLIYCYIARDLPLWILVLVLGRDLLILALAPVLSAKAGALPASDLSGRLAALSFGLLALVYLLDLSQFKVPLLAVATVLLVYSSMVYGRRLWSHAE